MPGRAGGGCRRVGLRDGRAQPLLGQVPAAGGLCPQRLLMEQPLGGVRVHVRDLGGYRPGRRVQDQVGQAQPALDGTLFQGQGLDPAVRNHVQRPPEEAAPGEQGGTGHEVAVAPPGERRNPAGAHRGYGESRPVSAAAHSRGEGAHRVLGAGIGQYQCQHSENLLLRAHGQQPGPRLHVAAGAGAVTGNVHLDRVPPLEPPQRRLAYGDRLDPPRRHGLGTGIQQPGTDPDAVLGNGGTEIEGGAEQAPVGTAETENNRHQGGEGGGLSGDGGQDNHRGNGHEQENAGAREQGRGDHPARGQRQDLLLPPDAVAGVVVRCSAVRQGFSGLCCLPGGSFKDADPQPLRIAQAQVGQTNRGFTGVGHLEAQFRQAENPGQERLDNVDGLHPVQPCLALLADQDPGMHPDVLAGELVAGKPPGQEEGPGNEQQRDPEGKYGPQQRLALGQAGVPVSEPGLGLVAAHEIGEGGQGYPAAYQRRDRMHPGPGVFRGGSRCAFLRRTFRLPAGGVGGIHSPASCASPREDRCSRRRAPSLAGSPAIEALVPGAAVCSFRVHSPNARSSGPTATSTYCIRP